MAVLDGNDQLGQLWSLIQELSEQLNQNRNISVSLHTQAGNIKTQSIHSQTGFVLRRFNLDKSIEEYNAELERMNTSIASENQELQYDNKQLNALIKEYEQTLDNLMSTFRNRAQDVQERELSLIREYETKLLARQEEYVAQDLANSTSIAESLVRTAHYLRKVLRSLGGEDVHATTLTDEGAACEPWMPLGSATDHALEREIELARLESENEELKRMLGLVTEHSRQVNTDTKLPDPTRQEGQQIPSMSNPGSAMMGPFGTYKRTRPQSS